MIKLTEVEKARWRSHVAFNPETGCDEWTAAFNLNGRYPVMKFRKVLTRADRLWWNATSCKQLRYEDLLIRRCRNPKCMTKKHWETRKNTWEGELILYGYKPEEIDLRRLRYNEWYERDKKAALRVNPFNGLNRDNN